MNNEIDEVKKQKALPVYNIDQINDVPDDEIQFVIYDQLFLETLLMELRGKLISFSRRKSKMQGVLVRSRAKIIEEDENPTIFSVTLRNIATPAK